MLRSIRFMKQQDAGADEQEGVSPVGLNQRLVRRGDARLQGGGVAANPQASWGRWRTETGGTADPGIPTHPEAQRWPQAEAHPQRTPWAYANMCQDAELGPCGRRRRSSRPACPLGSSTGRPVKGSMFRPQHPRQRNAVAPFYRQEIEPQGD